MRIAVRRATSHSSGRGSLSSKNDNFTIHLGAANIYFYINCAHRQLTSKVDWEVQRFNILVVIEQGGQRHHQQQPHHHQRHHHHHQQQYHQHQHERCVRWTSVHQAMSHQCRTVGMLHPAARCGSGSELQRARTNEEQANKIFIF
uniref:Uncharacterized protein n=1 Tax=Zeugodacus cucurbitae TaxID=28588 RepID=A0A0A1XLA0_ZEUCU